MLFLLQLINESFEAANLPFEIVDGFIGRVSVEIPWSALLSESTHVEIQGLEVTLKPKQVAEKCTGFLFSSFGWILFVCVIFYDFGSFSSGYAELHVGKHDQVQYAVGGGILEGGGEE